MLTIRDEQMTVFRQVALRNFEDNMVEHLQDFSLKHCLALGEDGVRKVVQLGIQQAGNYGFTHYGPVQFYIEMMFMLGSYFDTDCQLPWAARILKDPEIQDQDERADALFEKAMDYVEKVGGPHREYAIASLERASRENFKEACESRGSLETDILPRLKQNFSQKCEYAGDKALLQLIAQGKEQAEAHSVSSNPDVICFVFFMFMLGQGFADDPLYPWCGETLRDEAIEDPQKRVETLFNRGIAYINNALGKNGR